MRPPYFADGPNNAQVAKNDAAFDARFAYASEPSRSRDSLTP
jgi:hypothetical protein